jgi:hypothetical protein
MKKRTVPPGIHVHLKQPHEQQQRFLESPAKRKIVRAGRRGGKTTVAATYAVRRFLEGRRVLYAVPTNEQVDRFWIEVNSALAEAIENGIFESNLSTHTIEVRKSKSDMHIKNWNPEARIRAKTAWNADTLRGDYADDLILDEYQLMDEEAWHVVGAPMVMDNNGNAVLIYTPPSLASRSASKARDKRHAAKLFAAGREREEQANLSGMTPEWETFHWTSFDNPFLSREGLERAANDLSSIAWRQEIMAEDVHELPGALWKRATLDAGRVQSAPDLHRVVIGVDPPGGVTECGIIAAGVGRCSCRGTPENHGFVLADGSTPVRMGPEVWAPAVIRLYRSVRPDLIVVEKNYGGDMARHTIETEDSHARIKDVQATRGKAVRAEPLSAMYEQGKIHHVDIFPDLEDELCQWIPGMTGTSPNRMDALVWALTELMIQPAYTPFTPDMLISGPRRPEFLQPRPWPKEF